MIKVGIYGVGKVGRTLISELIKDNADVVEISFIDDPIHSASEITELLTVDNTYGYFLENNYVSSSGSNLIINETTYEIANNSRLNLPLSEVGLDLIIDCTGQETNTDQALDDLLNTGVKKAIYILPDSVNTSSLQHGIFVYDCNHKDSAEEDAFYIPEGNVICGSLALNVLNILNGFISTHIISHESNLENTVLFNYNNIDILSGIKRTTSNMNKQVGVVIPESLGKVTCEKIFYPVGCGSFLTCMLECNSQTIETINNAFSSSDSVVYIENLENYCSSGFFKAQKPSKNAGHLPCFIANNTLQNGNQYSLSFGYDALMILVKQIIKFILL